MTVRRSAGLLLWRQRARAVAGAGTDVEVLLGHLGGPLWARRDSGAWTIPKGELELGEEPLAAARREFAEELGLSPPDGPVLDLGEVRQRGGKLVRAFAVEADLDPAAVVPGTFTMEWPPRSGRTQDFPELDRVAWLGRDEARGLVVSAQAAFLDRLAEAVAPPR